MQKLNVKATNILLRATALMIMNDNVKHFILSDNL